MPSFLVETYLPKLRADDARRFGSRARSAADEISRRGTRVVYVRTTFVPDDETCFHLFESPSEALVAEACRRAGVHSPRIVLAVE